MKAKRSAAERASSTSKFPVMAEALTPSRRDVTVTSTAITTSWRCNSFSVDHHHHHHHPQKEDPMKIFLYMLNGMKRSFSTKKGLQKVKDVGKEVCGSMMKESKKKKLVLSSPGTVCGEGSNNFVSAFSKKGDKAVNQDSFTVWEEFGCQKDMIFCGIFDGHGAWGHHVAEQVSESMPLTLLRSWQETVGLNSSETKLENTLDEFDIWEQSYLKTCAAIDLELKQNRRIDSYNSGTTAVTIVRQGDQLFIANVGDSRAVLATTSNDGNLVPEQLTTDFKPNLPQEAERITQSKGLIFCLGDEPGVHRVWTSDGEAPGLAMSRAFGDYCVKDFGVISIPEITQRSISSKDQFVVIATDGVWDVISNKEAIQIVASTDDRGKAAKRLVQRAAREWKRQRRGIAVDDISAVCLFFHSYESSSQKI